MILFDACSTGGTTRNVSLNDYVTMPVFQNVCDAASFFSSSDMQTYPNPAIDMNNTCIPWFSQMNVGESITLIVKNNVAQYYYGTNFAGMCPAIGYQSEIPFPTTSLYFKDTAYVVGKALTWGSTHSPRQCSQYTNS